MRPRFAVLASVLCALVVVALPGIAAAAPRDNHGLTINATPNPINAGDGVLVYGQLNNPPVGGQTITLFHHISGSQQGFTPISKTTTDSHGFYEFTRAEGIVLTNRRWFTREAAIHGVHSRTVHERVSALVSLTASTDNTETRQPIVFSGHVTPNHAGEPVFLQEQKGNSDDWRTLKADTLGPASNYSIPFAWRVPGPHVVRVVVRTDLRNVRGESDPLTVTIQQAQVVDFTVNSSDPIIEFGKSATISGTLFMPGTTTPEPNIAVTLFGRTAGQGQFVALGAGSTDSSGNYSFTESPPHNTIYVVRTTLAPRRHTAPLFEGVRDVVTLASSSPTATVGGQVSFTGTVTPDKAGHVVYLQKLGPDGDWHNVEVRLVHSDASFQFGWTFGSAGTKQFRARIPGGPVNLGGASAPVTITVADTAAPLSSLPPAS
jgi:hypothetical protein